MAALTAQLCLAVAVVQVVQVATVAAPAALEVLVLPRQ
jgi:hypothetical protein